MVLTSNDDLQYMKDLQSDLLIVQTQLHLVDSINLCQSPLLRCVITFIPTVISLTLNFSAVIHATEPVLHI